VNDNEKINEASQFLKGDIPRVSVHRVHKADRVLGQESQEGGGLGLKLLPNAATKAQVFLLGLGCQLFNLSPQAGEFLTDVVDEGLVQGAGEVRGAAPGSQRPVRRVGLEELLLGLQGVGNLLVFLDVLLTAVDNGDVAKLEGVHFPI